MLFKRRHKPTHIEKLRVAVWPRHSWSRSYRYLAKRVMRLTASPHTIALGFAAGAAVSFTPFIGFHFILSFILAYIIRGNFLAAALGTSVGNPLTFPFIWASTYKLGTFFLYGYAGHPPRPEQLGHQFIRQSFDALWPIIKPMILGSIPLGIIAGVVFYFIIRFGVEAYQKTRQRRIQLRHKAVQLATMHKDRVNKSASRKKDDRV
ncbi:DUF2062 domain-containing protein [Flexibacterium corallicola]|uniref:DUF2062 domain-containing protein n=1 Tax=Flexibacterium corallicola TaxID=3037259 RepID=UPI00286F3739|nr:DUF2062 domain-containing protein [Pseudovibrio sp. M1P-2-3]